MRSMEKVNKESIAKPNSPAKTPRPVEKVPLKQIVMDLDPEIDMFQKQNSVENDSIYKTVMPSKTNEIAVGQFELQEYFDLNESSFHSELKDSIESSLKTHTHQHSNWHQKSKQSKTNVVSIECELSNERKPDLKRLRPKAVPKLQLIRPAKKAPGTAAQSIGRPSMRL